MSVFHIGGEERLSIQGLADVLRSGAKLELADAAKGRIQKCRDYLNEKLEDNGKAIYGINTGFGALYDKSIADGDLKQLQRNLVMSHAAGTGDEVPAQVVKLMLLLKAQGLSYGHSGAQVQTVQRLIDMYNNDVLPVVYQLGSLGASGDLAPLAHIALPLIGMGEVNVEGERMASKEALDKFGWEPIELQSKEGLALLNGTQFMSAYGCWCLINGNRLSGLADTIGALSLDAFDGRIEPFEELSHNIRPHAGQQRTAERVRELLEGSELIAREKQHVQDPYSFRCIPQVHGASKDVIAFAALTLETEINSATDNPNVFPDEDRIISAGNFHGQPLAIAMDSLCIALAELGSISERRIYKLLSGQRDLPEFLVAEPGLNSGLMIAQYTAASIVSQNKQLCTPASVDTIDSSNGQEDHVSMGANAATQCYRVTENLERILAIEMLAASQAIEFRKPARSSKLIEELVASYRKRVPFIQQDGEMHPILNASIHFLQSL